MGKKLIVKFLLVMCCFGSVVAHAQSGAIWDENKCNLLRDSLTELYEKKKFNGTVLIAENGSVRFHESFGYSNIAEKKKLDANASFRLASVSKQFTATAIMILAERGKLEYDDPITKHLPSLPYEKVTIRHLLNHTGGLQDYMMLMGKHWDKDKQHGDRRIAFNQDAVAIFAQHKPELMFEPGSKFAYSNTGYVFLGQIIENVSGIPVGQFIQKNIFEPVGMKDSRVFSPGDDFKLKHRVYGFRHVGQEPGYKPNDHHYLNGMIGDGGLYATAQDLLKWDQALYGEKLVSKPTLQQAFTSATLPDGSETGYGFGWGIDSKPETGKFQVSHSGGWVGFSTFIARNLSDRRTLIVLDNSSSGVSAVLSSIRKIVQSTDQ